MANSHMVRPKKKIKKQNSLKNNRIVSQMWLGILSDLPLFYQTCPIGPTLLGKTELPTDFHECLFKIFPSHVLTSVKNS